jgi:hypothetical protein
VSGDDAKSNSALGFLTVVQDDQHGLFGGYLLLNTAGRPLEFHCTAPIKPNRAQQILYGPTLEPYLFGEQIGQTLLVRGKLQPQVVCTDREPALAVREYVSMPVVLVLPCDDHPPEPGSPSASLLEFESRPQTKTYRPDAPHGAVGDGLAAFTLGRNRLALRNSVSHDRQLVADRLGELSDWFDLAEPFQRIREAIEEARRGAQ